MQKRSYILTIGLAVLLLLHLAGCTGICPAAPAEEESAPPAMSSCAASDLAHWTAMDTHWNTWLAANRVEPSAEAEVVEIASDVEMVTPNALPAPGDTAQSTSPAAETRPQATTPPADNHSGTPPTQAPPAPPAHTPPPSAPPANTGNSSSSGNDSGSGQTAPPPPSNGGGPTVVSPPATNLGENQFGGTDFGGGGAGCFWEQ